LLGKVKSFIRFWPKAASINYFRKSKSGSSRSGNWNSSFHLSICTRHVFAFDSSENSEFQVGTFQLPGSRKICISFGSWKLKLVKTESSRNTYRGVDFNTTRFVPGGFSCTNSPSSCTWRKVLDGYNRNILVNPKIIFEFIVLEHELLTEKHKAKTRAIGAAVKGAFRAFDPKPTARFTSRPPGALVHFWPREKRGF